MKVYGMRSEKGHIICLHATLDKFITSIINLVEDEKDFFEGYKPVEFDEVKEDED